MSTESQLSLSPDAGPNDDSAQVGEAARAREPRSRYRPDGSRRRTQGELQKRHKAKQERRAVSGQRPKRAVSRPLDREEEPVRNRSQTWQDRDGVWHNWRTPEPASESTSARTRNAQQTWHQLGEDVTVALAQGSLLALARIRPPPQPKRKVVEKWSLFEALRETSSEEEISKSSTPASTPTWHAVRCRVVAIGH